MPITATLGVGYSPVPLMMTMLLASAAAAISLAAVSRCCCRYTFPAVALISAAERGDAFSRLYYDAAYIY